jgi:drug/metabolite transporter (DMT)-like permease
VKPNRALIVLAFAAVYVLWGSTYFAIRIGVETLPPFLMAGTRFLVAGLPFYLGLRACGTPGPTRSQWAAGALTGSLMMCGGNGLVTWAEVVVPSAVAAVLIATVPLWMTLFDRVAFSRTRLHSLTVLGLLLGFAGVVILVSPTGSDLDRIDPVGGATLVFASSLWALGSLLARGGKLHPSPFMGAATQMICGGIALLALATLTGEWTRLAPAAVSRASLLAVLYLSLFGSVVSLSAYVYLLQVCSPVAVSTYAFVNPVVAVFLGAAFGGERFGPRAIVASVFIVLAVVIIIAARGHAAAHRAPPIRRML